MWGYQGKALGRLICLGWLALKLLNEQTCRISSVKFQILQDRPLIMFFVRRFEVFFNMFIVFFPVVVYEFGAET